MLSSLSRLWQLAIFLVALLVALCMLFWKHALELLRACFVHAMTKKLKAPVSLEALHLHRWGFELIGLKRYRARPSSWCGFLVDDDVPAAGAAVGAAVGAGGAVGAAAVGAGGVGAGGVGAGLKAYFFQPEKIF